MRALVVEDSRSMRRLLEMLLRERGHDVVSVGTAEDGLLEHERGPFDLMLLDWVLPGMTGLELAKKVRGLPHGDAVVILVLTGREGREHLEAVLDAGANDYLAKPLDPDLLRTRLLIAERSVAELGRRRDAEAALRRSEMSFRAVIEAAPDGIVVRREGTIIYANPALVAYLGWSSPMELLGRSYSDIVHRDDRAAVSEADLGEGPTERQFLRRVGETTLAEVFEIGIVYDGRPAILEVIRDLTERREIQGRMQLADRMTSVGTLAAGVAHELNNPLAYVISNLRLMQEEISTLQPVLAPERLKVFTELVEESSQGAGRMSHIVRDLKTFSRADDDMSGPIDLDKVIESSINMAWNQLRHRARVVKAFGDLPKVTANESRIGQVVLNLLLNAAQALPEGHADQNEVRVRTRTDDHGWAVVEIEDTGSGITKETLARMYDPFFTTKSHGTGLGLSICHNIVHAAGGEINVDTTVGAGTTFQLRLPPAERQSLAPVPPSQRVPPGIGPVARVLVVDDEALVGRSIKRALRGHDVTVVTNGEKAVELILADGDFDVVLCDLMMPEVSGMDVYERVRAAGRGLEERIIFMTGGAFTPRGREFLDTVPNEQIGKPFDLKLIRQLVRDRAPDPYEATPVSIAAPE
ncbi:MAG: response regulator [Myxococcota bacterium]